MVAPSIHFLVLSPVFKAYRAQYTNFAYWDVFKQLCTIPSWHCMVTYTCLYLI